jgi:hypothetical protein
MAIPPESVPMVRTAVTGFGEADQVHACALCLEYENVVAKGHNLHLQAHAVDDLR